MKQIFPLNISRAEFKNRLLQWSTAFANVAHYDNNEYEHKYRRFECLTAVSNKSAFRKNAGDNAWEGFSEYLKAHSGEWQFGYFGYDLKNELEKLHSGNPDFQKAADLCFFNADILVMLKPNASEIEISAENPVAVFNDIISTEPIVPALPTICKTVSTRISKSAYIDAVAKIREHIIAGDLYEMNFCQEFYAEDVVLPGAQFFALLNTLSPAPFAAWFKCGNEHIFCASPERFLYKAGDKILSQPIKGTQKRGGDTKEDEVLKTNLYNSEKDRAENVMIVDLVRNDLARTAMIGTVEVEELFGIYGFRQVWQMISTVSARISPETDMLAVIKAAFPPGSMTGAPKVMSMELIEQYESSKRGAYSGTLGYFSPDGDFDFNVLIRSVFYNSDTKRLSFQTGGAIVFDSDPEKEYEECLLKAKGILMALGALAVGG